MKIRVGVFFGGKSVEHEVSVISAMQAMAALDAQKYQVVPVYVSKENILYTGPEAGRIDGYRDLDALTRALRRVDLVSVDGRAALRRHKGGLFGGRTESVLDVALLVFHGTGGEDGVIQGLMEHVGLPYTGCDVTASACGMDKWVMKALFQMAGVPCLPAVRVARDAFFSDAAAECARVEEAIGYPCIVKPVNLGSSVGIGRADDRDTLESALETALTYAHTALCERAVAPLREINCAVLGDSEAARASVCEEPVLAGAVLTFADKYQRGGKGGRAKAPAEGGAKGGMAALARRVPADLPDETAEAIRALAVRAFHAIGAAGVARVDFLMDAQTGDVWVNEINTIPGSLSFYLWEAAGLPFGGLLDELIALAFKRERERARLSFSFETNLLQSAGLLGAKGRPGKI